MDDKKKKAACDTNKNGKLSPSNDQIGENAGEGRFEKHVSPKGGKNR